MYKASLLVLAVCCLAAVVFADSSEERSGGGGRVQYFGYPTRSSSGRSSTKRIRYVSRPRYVTYEAPQTVRYVQPAPKYRPAPKYDSSEEYDSANYQFAYRARAEGGHKGYGGSGSAEGDSAEFGHAEQRSGDKTDGKYFVELPDGRLQTVEYYVHGDSGYVAKVSYSGGSGSAEQATYGGGAGAAAGSGDDD